MQASASRFSNLFGRRSDKAAAAAKSHRRAAKNRLATHFEPLESRAMLALTYGGAYNGSGITANLVEDYTDRTSTTVTTGAGATAVTTTTINYTNLYDTLNVTIGSDTDLYLYRTNGLTSFYSSDSLASGALLFQITDGTQSFLPHTIVNGATTASDTFPFASIAIHASNNATSPKVYVVGGGLDLNKQSLYVNLTQPTTGRAFDDSVFYSGTPVVSAGAGAFGARTLSSTYAAGDSAIAAETITFAAAYTANSDLFLDSDGTVDAAGLTDATKGTFVLSTVTASGGDVVVNSRRDRKSVV